MPLPQQQPLNYRLQSPAQYMPDPSGAHYAPEDTLPFDVDIFDETLGSLQSDETRYVVPREMWLESLVTSASEGDQSDAAFSFQIMAVISDPASGTEDVVVAQEKPINSTLKFGSAQYPAALSKKMQYFPPGTELVCQVSNLQNASNAIQIVLRMYMRNLPNIPQQVGH